MILSILFLAVPAFSQYIRPGSKDNAVPNPIPVFRQSDYSDLAGGLVMETRSLAKLHAGRGLVLWMKNAQKTEMTEYISCPDSVNGSRYSGEIYASLLDTQTHRVLQTLYFDMTNMEGNSLPFRITSGLYSTHGKANPLGEKETVLLDPVQLDPDPICEEYAFYEDPGGCFCPDVFPFGYDLKTDKIFRFKEIVYRVGEEVGGRTEWEFMTELYFEVIGSPRKKVYDFSSSIGHGSDVFTLHRFKYDRKLRAFYGVNVDVPDDDKHNELYLDKEGNLTPSARRYLDNVWKEKKPQAGSDKN
jgi:hypothetical protein